VLRLLPLSWAEWRHHPWRHAAALLAVALGVALASSVQLINHAALSEFGQAVRAVNGEPDVVLAGARREGFDDALLGRLALDERVAALSPVLEVDTLARRTRGGGAVDDVGGAGGVDGAAADAASAPGAQSIALKVIGLDALQVAATAPALMPRPAPGATTTTAATTVLDPTLAWPNPAALARLKLAPGDTIELQSPGGWRRLRVGGSVAAGGAPLVVVDLAAAQQAFSRDGRLSRIDVKLAPGVDRNAWLAAQTLPPQVRVAAADEALQRISNLSLAYRVNLGVLALVALLVGGFLVYSVVSLSVAQRTPTLALLGVLGLAARERRRLVLLESAAIGVLGSALGLAGGALLAWAALRLLGADLGGGYFPGLAPQLQWPWMPMTACFALGVAATVAGAWWPARQAERLAPALALKGLGSGPLRPPRVAPGLVALVAGGLLALAPPVAGLPLAAYASVALLLGGGVALVPVAVQALLERQGTPRGALWLLALRRARFARQTASATVAGVVASLALSVALTVMVASFRDAVSTWLDQVLPADLYLRTAPSAAAAEQALLPDGFAASAAALPGVARVQVTRQRLLSLDPHQPALALVARPLADPAATLPLRGTLLPAAEGTISVYASEPAAALYGWSVGDRIRLPIEPIDARGEATSLPPLLVRGIWRDYARQFGAVAIDLGDYRRLTGDEGLNDLAVWLGAGASGAAVEAALKRLAGADRPVEISSTAELRRLSLAIFDRSFAVTRYLQAVAIAVGLVGVAASLSAQVLARRKEFGLLAHLGLTRHQVTALVTLETLAWLVAGCAVGLGLGAAIALVLVHVVNPQSFHWTMEMRWPAGPLAALAGAVLVAGGLTAALSARRAAARQAVLAVKEDW
jgi:putative ABC transport system permease protein